MSSVSVVWKRLSEAGLTLPATKDRVALRKINGKMKTCLAEAQAVYSVLIGVPGIQEQCSGRAFSHF